MTSTDDLLASLRTLDTPTVCNALEVVAPARRGWGYTTRPLLCARPELPPLVGYARTATVAAAHPSGRTAAEDRETRLAYYRYVDEGGPRPSIVVIQDLDDPPGHGAWWGEVNTNVHQGLGALGVVTDGSIRDLPDCAPGFQLLAGSVGPSHAFVHVVEFGVTVTVAGLTVRPGDLLHADRHGAVVVPEAVAAAIPDAAAEIVRAERRLIDASRAEGFSSAEIARLLRDAEGH